MEPTTPSPATPPAGIDPAAAPANLPAPAASGSAPPPAPEEPEPEFGHTVPDYDPAEYRWVPVRRRPRSDGWTEEKQRRFIEVLADTGLVALAAKAVGMPRQSAYKLRRAPYAAAFARAWDIARERAGTLIEDIAFERAIEGVEEDQYNANGELTDSRRIYNDRLLTFLLSHLKPERYSREARRARAEWHFGGGPAPSDPSGEAGPKPKPAELAPPATPPLPAEPSLDAALRAMEPQLPAPPHELTDPEQLADDLLCADILDGKLPHHAAEQRPPLTPAQERAAANAAQIERGRLADAKFAGGEELSEAEMADWCAYLDPSQAGTRRRPPRGRT